MRLSEFVHEGDNAIILHLCMCVYTYIHICIHVCVCVCVRVCLRACVCVRKRAGPVSLLGPLLKQTQQNKLD